MKIVFISNYINHHQKPFSDHMYSILGSNYCFIQTEPMEEERVNMGWGLDVTQIPYVIELQKDEDKARVRIEEADAVIFGGTERFDLIRKRMDDNRLTFINSERIYKEGQWKFISPKGLVRKYKDYIKYRKKNIFLLCCGAYVASDFHLIHAFPDKMLKWGYFPPFMPEDIENVIHAREKQMDSTGVTELIWAGRMIELKHPEHAIETVRLLVEEGYSVHLTMAGAGAMEEELKKTVEEHKLNQNITFTGFCKPEEIREYMRKASVFIFTSNFIEGWGAVLSEAMNSGCAVVSSRAAGATGFLVQDGYNGFSFPYKKFPELYEKVKYLLDNKEARCLFSKKAYDTIAYSWNAHIAAERMLVFCERFMETGRISYEAEGILSPAKPIRPGKTLD